MATYGFDDLTVKIDASVGGSLTSLNAYVIEITAFGVEAIIEDSHTVGDSWVEKLYTGLRQADEFTITGFYDDTASTGSNAMLIGVGDVRSFQFTWGSTKTSDFECLIQKYDRMPAKGELTKFSATLVPSGAVTEV